MAQRLTLNDLRATLVLRSTQVSGGPPLLDVDPRPGVDAPGLFSFRKQVRLSSSDCQEFSKFETHSKLFLDEAIVPAHGAAMETRALAQVAEVITGSSPDRRVARDAVRFIQIKDLDPQKRDLVAGKRPTAKRAIAAQMGDVLLAARGGQAVVAGDAAGAGLEGAYPTLDVYLIRPDQKRVDPAYLAAWLTFEPIRSNLQASTTGALIPRIPIGSLKDLSVPLPSLERQRQVGALFQLAHREASLLDQLAANTAQLRTRQLAAAFATLES